MTTRERNLAMLLGVIGVLIVGYYGLTSLASAFGQRRNELESVEKNIRQKELTIQRGARAVKKRTELRQNSLPADAEVARSNFQTWLIRSAEEERFSRVNVTSAPSITIPNVFTRLTFNLDAQATLEETVRFLHKISAAGYLHRIESLTLDPINDSKDLKVVLRVDALALTDSENKELIEKPGKRLAHPELQPYLDKIVGRNVFGPANNPPELADASIPKAHPKTPFKYTFKATDPDKGDKVSFQLDREAIEGMQIDKSSGELRWTPEKLGEFEFAVLAMDNGAPAKSVSKKFKLSVVDPPPQAPPPATKPNYESAKQALVSGVVYVNDMPEVWINVRTEGKILKLREGEPIQLGEFKAIVKRIEGTTTEIEVNGTTQRIRQGDALVPAEG